MQQGRHKAAEILALIGAVFHGGAAAQDLHVDARARNVDAPACAALDIVDRLRRAVQDETKRAYAAGNVHGSGKIVARARGNEPQRADGGVGKPAHHLVEGAVAAHYDELLAARLREAARILARVPRALGIKYAVSDPARTQALFRFRNDLFIAPRMTVDDDVEHTRSPAAPSPVKTLRKTLYNISRGIAIFLQICYTRFRKIFPGDTN